MRTPKDSTVPFSPNIVNHHSKTKLLENNGRRFPSPTLSSSSNKPRPALTIPRPATHILQMRPNDFAISTLKKKGGHASQGKRSKEHKETQHEGYKDEHGPKLKVSL